MASAIVSSPFSRLLRATRPDNTRRISFASSPVAPPRCRRSAAASGPRASRVRTAAPVASRRRTAPRARISFAYRTAFAEASRAFVRQSPRFVRRSPPRARASRARARFGRVRRVSPGVAKPHRTQKHERAQKRPEQEAPQHDADRSDVVLGEVRPVDAPRVAPRRALRVVAFPGHHRDEGTRDGDVRGASRRSGGVRHVAGARVDPRARPTRSESRASVSASARARGRRLDGARRTRATEDATITRLTRRLILSRAA